MRGEIVDIVWENDQIGGVSAGKAAQEMVLPGGEGRSSGVSSQSFAECEALVGIPAVLTRRTIRAAARHRGVDSQEWVGRFYRRV
jgi:hypothetical protein